MNKDVIISVKGKQYYQDIDYSMDSIELVTEGKYYKKGNHYYVTYKETEMTGMEGTTTTLKIEDGKVTLMRFGPKSSQLIFEEGEKHLCHYDTLHGAFTVGVFSNKVNINMNDFGGEMTIDYFIELNQIETGKNDLYMCIREANLTNDKFNGNSKEANYSIN